MIEAQVEVNMIFTRMSMTANSMSVILCAWLALLTTQEQEVHYLLFIVPDIRERDREWTWYMSVDQTESHLLGAE